MLIICIKNSRLRLEYTDCISAAREDLPTNKCPGYDIKQSDGEAPVLVELWGMQNTPSLPKLQSRLLAGVVTLEKVLSMVQMELFDINLWKQMTYDKLNCLK